MALGDQDASNCGDRIDMARRGRRSDDDSHGICITRTSHAVVATSMTIGGSVDGTQRQRSMTIPVQA
jgi:hypothetical protein